MHAFDNCTGLILAGGAGKRVGGSDKGLLHWHGQPLAAHVARRLRPQVGRLLVSCNRNSDYYATLADATICDSRGNYQGPLAGMEAAAGLIKTEFLVVSPCDMPLIPTDLVSRLLAPLVGSSSSEIQVSYARDGQHDQYLCAAMRCSVLASLQSYLDEGQRAVRHWYARHRCAVVDFSDEAASFINYNQPD